MAAVAICEASLYLVLQILIQHLHLRVSSSAYLRPAKLI